MACLLKISTTKEMELNLTSVVLVATSLLQLTTSSVTTRSMVMHRSQFKEDMVPKVRQQDLAVSLYWLVKTPFQ
jgi:hypothetical protein